jgi:hypothetical protein
MAMVTRFNRFDPKRSPRVKSGFPIIATELIPVKSSGSEVIVARSTTPIQMRPSPVFSAIASPYLDSLVPATTMIARQTTNFIQTRIDSYICLLSQNNSIFRCASGGGCICTRKAKDQSGHCYQVSPLIAQNRFIFTIIMESIYI